MHAAAAECPRAGFWARVLDGKIHCHGVSLLDLPSAFECLSIEGELAVRIAEDISDTDGLTELSEPGRLIESVFPIIELHNHVIFPPGPLRQRQKN